MLVWPSGTLDSTSHMSYPKGRKAETTTSFIGRLGEDAKLDRLIRHPTGYHFGSCWLPLGFGIGIHPLLLPALDVTDRW